MNVANNDLTVLVLAPHTDDAEFGMGGTIAKLIKQGYEVHQVNFSTASQISEHGTRNKKLEQEVKDASKELGVDPTNLYIHDFPVRNFQANRQEILDLMLYYKKAINPSMIFVPASNDIHQDHQAIHNEALRAFKFESIYGYELIWNLLTTNYQMFVHLDKEMVDQKTDAIMRFESQHHRPYTDRFKIMSWSQTRGMQCNQEYAEVFEVIRINNKL